MNQNSVWNKSLIKQLSWKHDLFAGLTVAILLVPQGMAYAVLAGMPPIYGLYAAFMPLLIYPLFATSKHLSVGPVALISIILFGGLSELALPGSIEFIELALLTAMLAGLIQLLLAWFKLGFLVNFLSQPVIYGFTAAAATIIIFSQLKSVLGITVPRSTNIIQTMYQLITHVHEAHLITMLIGFVTMISILVLKRIKKSIPAGILAVVIGTALVYFFQLHETGLQIVGEVPSGLPSFSVDFIRLENILSVLPLSFVICLISFIESLAISKTIAAKNGDYYISADRELLGLGVGKFIGAFFSAYPSSGSFSRSAVNDEIGAKSGFSSIFAAVFIMIILLFLTPLFFYLPLPILGAIVITAVYKLIDINYAKNLLKFDKKDFYVYITTFTLTLLLGVQEGVVAGIVLSIILIIQKTATPHYAVLGNLPGTRSFRNVKRYENAVTRPDVLVMRYDQDLYFGNTDHFYDSILKEINAREGIKTVILNSSAIGFIDSTGLSKLKLLLAVLKTKGITLLFTHVRGPIRDKFLKTDMWEIIGKENLYLSINDAMASLQNPEDFSDLHRNYAKQSFYKKKE